MIEFRILGPLDLRSPDGTELRPVLSQPKRLVLLAYLAATPGSFRRRDTLLGLFWPEFDQRRARAALRQSIYHLRRTLGSDVVIGRGDEELGVDPSRLWCDVAAFRQAVAEGRFHDAVELYRGELLDGIYIDGAPEVERWIEEERARLQAMAARAAWSLAEATADDPVAAAGWARRAVEFMPDDEASVRRLIDFLASSGDRAGALRVYEEFARRLERDYETTPSAATQELIERVRAADPGPADDRAASGSAPRRGPRPRGGDARPAPARSPSTFAFLPFTFRGAPEYGYLAEGVPELLALAIDGAGTLRSVDPFALQGWLSREGAGLPDPERIGAIGERFGAGYCVTGGIVEAGGRIRVHASLHATDSPEAPRARVAAEAGVDEVLALVDRLATDLLVDGIEAPHGELARVAAKTTESLSALKAYLTGEHEYRAGRYSPAAESFHLAVEEDPGFALAHYRLATLAEWAGYPSGAEAVATLAVQHADRLSVNDLRLLEALRAYFEGDVARAEHLYREILAIHPDSVEAWFQLAKLGYFLNTLRGRPIGEARDALDRAAELDPDNIIVLVHQALLAVKAGCPDDVDAFTRRALALLDRGDYADFPLLIRVIRTFGLPGQSGQSELWSELEAANPSTLFWCMAALTCAIGDVAAAERLSEVAIRPTQPAPVRLFGRLARAGLALGRGRWSGARDELAEAARLDPVTATVNHAFLALVHFRDPGPEELYALRDELSALTAPEPSADPVLEPWFSAHSELFDASRTYLLGLIHVRLGELEEAEARAVELDALAASAPGLARASHARDAARGIRAQIACRRGALDEALACLEACELAAPTHLYFSSVLYGRLHERCLRAELLARLGREAEAGSWYAALEDSPHGAPYLALSHLRRAELLERRGEDDRARVHRARFAELWQGADPELRSLSRAVTDLPVLRPVPGERVAAEEPAPAVRTPVPRRRRRAPLLVLALLLAVSGILALVLRDAPDRSPPPRELAGRIQNHAAVGDPGFAGVTTSSLVAYRFYEEGLGAYYNGDRPRALQLFRAALAEDSTFALAAYFAAKSAAVPESFELASQAVRFAERTSERERLLIEAGWAAMMDDPRRLALAETLAARYLEDPDGHLLLGQARLWGGDFLGAAAQLRHVILMDSAGLRGERPGCYACDAYWDLGSAYVYADSFAAAERVGREWAKVQPHSAQPWIALAYLYEAQNRYDEALEALDSASARAPGYQGLDIRTGALLRAGDFDGFERLTHELYHAGGPQARGTLLWAMALGYRTQGRMEEALRAARELVWHSSRPPATPEVVVLNRVAEAQVLWEAGRVREAAALFETLASSDIAAGSTARNARHRAWMLTHAAGAYAALDDTARLRVLADSVERLGAQSAYARDQRLHHHIRGLLLRAEGRLEEAAERFRRALFSPVTGYTRTNYELARTLLDLGRPEEAIPVLEAALRGPVGASGYYLTRTELHALLGRALEEAGRADEARAHFRWAETAWGRGEPQ